MVNAQQLKNSILCVQLLALASNAWAKVVELPVQYDYYNVQPKAGQSLLQALNSASTINGEGKKYHGRTTWRVRWDVEWHYTQTSCRLTQVNVELELQMLLPRLVSADAEFNKMFGTFDKALRLHEMGHVHHGEIAAHEIDAALQQLPSMNNCQLLRTEIDRRANAIVKTYSELDQRYDRETQHGKTQGAWIESQ